MISALKCSLISIYYREFKLHWIAMFDYLSARIMCVYIYVILFDSVLTNICMYLHEHTETLDGWTCGQTDGLTDNGWIDNIRW